MSSSIEGTFIPLNPPGISEDSTWVGPAFINPNFREEDEDSVDESDFKPEQKPPLSLLFPDLEQDDVQRSRAMSTTQLTRMLVGKKADFSLLRPLKKLNPLQKLPPLEESQGEGAEEESPQTSIG